MNYIIYNYLTYNLTFYDIKYNAIQTQLAGAEHFAHVRLDVDVAQVLVCVSVV